jgi:hypothetical protein
MNISPLKKLQHLEKFLWKTFFLSTYKLWKNKLLVLSRNCNHFSSFKRHTVSMEWPQNVLHIEGARIAKQCMKFIWTVYIQKYFRKKVQSWTECTYMPKLILKQRMCKWHPPGWSEVSTLDSVAFEWDDVQHSPCIFNKKTSSGIDH